MCLLVPNQEGAHDQFVISRSFSTNRLFALCCFRGFKHESKALQKAETDIISNSVSVSESGALLAESLAKNYDSLFKQETEHGTDN